MALNPLMSRERVVNPPRKAPTKAEKTAAWNAANGLCELCGKPVAYTGPDVEYDHTGMRAVTGDDTATNLRPLHVRCHAGKTAKHDAPLMAKVRGQEKLTKVRVKSAQGFRRHPTLYRGLDGKVKERRS